jgi:transcription initiation factor TFIIIB Brf1 subunit/transcription initiation factor TFIIB
MQSEPPANERDQHERERHRLERALPELIKRILDVGYGKISEGPESVRNFVSELKLPKEVLNLLIAQVDETKSGLYRVVAKELRDSLEHAKFSDEIARLLSTVRLEIKTEVRFIPNEASTQPVLGTQVSVQGQHTSQQVRAATKEKA